MFADRLIVLKATRFSATARSSSRWIGFNGALSVLLPSMKLKSWRLEGV